ncbi:MAG: hypothetical protein KF809_16745 [Chloroflexi bacterium]|nr:hypothetical protein [Chloroflexota bacterium]
MTSPDPWTAFLDLLTKAIVPDWSGLIVLLPFLLLVGVLGPIMSLIALAWVYHFLTKRRARVRVAEAEATLAVLDAGGAPSYPANTPYCPEHALIYPVSRVRCEIDGADLAVRCPVDGTVRDAGTQTCNACGTRFVLGATSTSDLVRRPAGPPEGGAAVA